MRPPSVTQPEFDTLLARAGLGRLPPAERPGIHAVWGAVEAMLESVRTPGGADEVAAAAAEPSNTFSAALARRGDTVPAASADRTDAVPAAKAPRA